MLCVFFFHVSWAGGYLKIPIDISQFALRRSSFVGLTVLLGGGAGLAS